jgi:signal transduction histidine kinase
MAPLATERGLRLSLEGQTDVVFEADRGRILQVFANLVGNAIKASPASGNITLGGSEVSNCIRFWVEDAGPGISPNDIPYIFDRFWRGRDARDWNRPRADRQRHRGARRTVWVESRRQSRFS